MHTINYGALLEALRVADRKECIYTYSDSKPCCVVGWYLYLCKFNMNNIEKNALSLSVNYKACNFLNVHSNIFEEIQEIWDDTRNYSDYQARDTIYNKYIKPFVWQ